MSTMASGEISRSSPVVTTSDVTALGRLPDSTTHGVLAPEVGNHTPIQETALVNKEATSFNTYQFDSNGTFGKAQIMQPSPIVLAYQKA